MRELADPCMVSGTHSQVLGTAGFLGTPRNRPASGCDVFRSLNELIVLKVLGRGTFASVRQAIHRPSGRIFALKTVARAKVLKEGGKEEHIVREANAQLRMRHRNIVQLYGHFEDSERVHFVLEFVAGGQLLERMRKMGRLSREEAARMFYDVISALMFIHEHNIVHRDIKPENVLLQQQDKSDNYIAKIGDFGCCAMVSDMEPTRNTLCGTMDYLAPEMIDQQPHDHKVDVWASGVLLYEMLVGEAPFKAKSQLEALRRIINSAVQCPSYMDQDAANLIRLLLHKNAQARLPLAQAANHDFVKKYSGRQQPDESPELHQDKKNAESAATVGNGDTSPILASKNASIPTLKLGLLAKPIAEQESRNGQSISPLAQRPVMPMTARVMPVTRSPSSPRLARLSTPATLKAGLLSSPQHRAQPQTERRISAEMLLPLEAVPCEASSPSRQASSTLDGDESGCSHRGDDTPSCSLLSGTNTTCRNSSAFEQTLSRSAKGGTSSPYGIERTVGPHGIVESSIGTYSCSSRTTVGGLSMKTTGSRLRSLTPPQGELEESIARVSEVRSVRSSPGSNSWCESPPLVKNSPRRCETSPRETPTLPFTALSSGLLVEEAAYQLEADTSQVAVCTRATPRAKATSTRKGSFGTPTINELIP